MSKADEAFWQWYAEALKKGWSDDNARRYDSRLVYRAAWASRGVADVEAVRAAFDAIPDAIAGSGLDLAEDATARIAALDEGGGE